MIIRRLFSSRRVATSFTWRREVSHNGFERSPNLGLESGVGTLAEVSQIFINCSICMYLPFCFVILIKKLTEFSRFLHKLQFNFYSNGDIFFVLFSHMIYILQLFTFMFSYLNWFICALFVYHLKDTANASSMAVGFYLSHSDVNFVKFFISLIYLCN